MINVAVMGYGTIGSGVVEVLETNKDIISKRAGSEVCVKYVLDLRDFPGTSIENKIVHDFSIIENDKDVDVVVETMGGLNPAYSFVKKSLEAGKHVATSNKALVAAHGTELLKIARENSVNFFFEASTGGGIPVIRSIYQALAGEKIQEITGILNGTTNFILTKMDKEGASFEDVLKEAQDLGYAERNPEADVEGHDTCRKIAILTAMATEKEVNYENIYTEGITKITDIDFRYADKMGTSIKLFGSSKIENEKVSAWVAPVMIGKDHPLYTVSDVYNGIMIKSNMLGTSMFYGSGAGKLPTAAAVVADIIEAARNLNSNVPLGWSDKVQGIEPMKETRHRFFIRLKGKNKDKHEAALKNLGNTEIITLEGLNEFAVLTEEMTEGQWAEASKKFDGILQVIRADI